MSNLWFILQILLERFPEEISKVNSFIHLYNELEFLKYFNLSGPSKQRPILVKKLHNILNHRLDQLHNLQFCGIFLRANLLRNLRDDKLAEIEVFWLNLIEPIRYQSMVLTKGIYRDFY